MTKTLSDYRESAGYKTQESLAMAMGVNRPTVTRWEHGKRCPRPLMILKLAEKLNISEKEVIIAIESARRGAPAI